MILLQDKYKDYFFYYKDFSHNLFDVITKFRYIHSIYLHISKWVKSYLSWVKNVLCKINTFDADKYHPRQYSVEFSKLCFTFLLSHKICHVSNNLYWQHELLQKLFVAMTLGSMFRYRNLKLKMSYQNYLVPQNLTIYYAIYHG